MTNGGSPRPAVRAVGLTKRYGKVCALDHLDLDLAEGEILGYLGPNGAGKTTTLRLLLGLARPSEGRAEIFGLDCSTDAVDAHRQLAYVPGEAALWPSLTGRETLDLLGGLRGGADEAYRSELLERFDLDVSRKVRTYSKGNKQKVLLVAALMSRPRLLLLDEPTSGLDPLMEQQFRLCVQEAKERGQTILLSSHILSEVEAVCDRVAILRNGRLVDEGALIDLRHLGDLVVEAFFATEAEASTALSGVARLDAVDSPARDGRVVRCHVRGTISPLLEELARCEPLKLLSREPSLEELFLALYS